MSSPSLDGLPDVQKGIRTRPLFVMTLDVAKPIGFGTTPNGDRRVGVVAGGRFEGERLSGEVLEGGSDWQIARPDGSTTLDVRLILKTADGALIGMSYRGLRHGPPDVMAELAKGGRVDPADYYFRVTGAFETASANYDWLNRVLAIGVGDRQPGGPVYSLFELL
ncbi:DUF3237 domain-containing protein [Labrys sp. ZIDIC5]|uniref:DUF3237 domain-containing protein n=1 Tax=Labrys sedimenti TaxID=3106036 RepID=UPI002ACA7DE9|nr:DUF3237 domain-containing protein [Labrys sp. ZIDIC5]MDZ5448358.1 DUF3237 domain-containing protein [Labrys sp. ZIDIC5]